MWCVNLNRWLPKWQIFTQYIMTLRCFSRMRGVRENQISSGIMDANSNSPAYEILHELLKSFKSAQICECGVEKSTYLPFKSAKIYLSKNANHQDSDVSQNQICGYFERCNCNPICIWKLMQAKFGNASDRTFSSHISKQNSTF